MPKPFLLAVEVEELALGHAMRKIRAVRGVVSIRDLEQSTKKPKANGFDVPERPRKQMKKFDVKAKEFVASVLFKEPTSAKVMKQHFADVGRSTLSVNSTFTEMKDDGLVKLQDDGTWMLTKKGRDRTRHQLPKKGR